MTHQRAIAHPLIQNDGCYLLSKMTDNRGAFPGQQVLSGGSIEPDEHTEETLRREMRGELGEQLALSEVTSWTFSDDIRTKTYANGSQEETYVIYLILDCVATNHEARTNEEFQAFAWTKLEDLGAYDPNITTHKALTLKGLLQVVILIAAHN